MEEGSTLPYLPDHYTHDGSQNNPLYRNRGTVGSPRIRAHPPLHSYIDASPDNGDEPLWHHPRLDLPSPRKILVDLFQKVTPRRNEQASQLLMAFGHFFARDITRTIRFNESEPMPIECDMVETRGPFCPKGQELMGFYRAIRSTNDDNTGEPINFATTWLDLDHIYGNAPPTSHEYLKYRTGKGGEMKLDNSTGLPPIDPDTGLYMVHDIAMRKLPGDLALTATFLHYHNRRAVYHQEHHPECDDETIFHKARMDTVAVYQMTFEEKYIPAVLGVPLSDYRYYPNIDASIDVFFATSSFRYGHSGVSGVVRLLNEELEPIPQDPMLMRDVHNKTEEAVRLITGNDGSRGRYAIASILRGLAHDVTRALDASFVDDMSLFMDGAVASNIQRGRDNGLPSYNEAREWFLDDIAESYLDLAQGNEAVARMLEGLYGEGNVDDVDAYVGSMLENPVSKHKELGPLNEASMREQFERLRNGDRLYYRERLTPDEIQELDTLSDLVRYAWGEEEMKYFPEDLFAIVPSGGSGNGEGMFTGGSMKLFNGDMTIQWEVDKEHIDFTVSTPYEKVSGGYIGLGWGSNAMKGSEIWFCKSTETGFSSEACVADEASPERPSDNTGLFTCCVADGHRHVRPECDGSKNYLTVLNSCASDEGSYVTVRARLCSGGSGDCFSHEGNLDFIAAYNPADVNAAHGFSRRTGGGTNLALGTAATCSDDSAQAGLFALHGVMLLLAWLFLAPIAIYVVRYMKDKPWRLRVHITLVGIIGGLMLTLVTAALVSVEGTAFGTEDAEGATFSRHKTFGLSIVFFVMFMIATGELRRQRVFSQRLKSVVLEHVVIIAHRCGGLLLTGVAWYNCYTGLVQIGPYESDSVEVTFLSSTTVSLGYDLEFFGFVRKYLFFPWICIIILVFFVKEMNVRRELRNISMNIDATMGGVGNVLTINEKDLPEMTVKTFLFLTKHGSALSILDGYVIDIQLFMDVHPGGTNVLRYAVGCDITSYFVGELDVNGLRHKHSPKALSALRPLVKSRLEKDHHSGHMFQSSNDSNLGNSTTYARNQSEKGSIFSPIATEMKIPSIRRNVFRKAKIVGHDIVSPKEAGDQKCVIRLRISVKREDNMDSMVGTPLPTSTFVFRVFDSHGNAFERPYNISKCYLSKPRLMTTSTVLPLRRSTSTTRDDIEYEFFISLVPGGKMSSVLAKKTVGRTIMVNGPMASKGTGITPGLQLIDYYLRMPKSPKITLLWFVRERYTSFEEALKLQDRERASANFQYIIISDNNGDTTPKIIDNSVDTKGTSNDRMREHEAREVFLQLCHSKGILHQETADALLTWISLSGETDDVGSYVSESESDGVDPELCKDITLSNLSEIAESLKTGLEDQMHDRQNVQCFCGCDAVSFLVEHGYTPSRKSALAFGREVASKLDLFTHATDAQRLLLDDADQYYTFREIKSFPSFLARKRTIRHLDDVLQGFLVALCGHSLFEQDMIDVLKIVGVVDDQIVHFPEGSLPLSQLPEFVHQETAKSES